MKSHSPGPKSLASEDVAQRDILWLPPLEVINLKRPGRTEAPVFNLSTQQHPAKGFYNHPILVISRPQNHRDKIQFLLLTTYSNQKLAKRFRGRHKMHHWQRNLALDPCIDHPLRAAYDTMYAPLKFEGGPPTETEGYLKVSEVFEMQWQDVEEYWIKIPTAPARTRLDKASFDVVLEAVAKFACWQPGPQLKQTSVSAAETQFVRALPATPAPVSPLFYQGSEPNAIDRHAQAWSAAALPVPARGVSTRSTDVREWTESSNVSHNLPRESEHLLPKYHAPPSTGKSYAQVSFWAWLWDYLKRTRLGIILNFVFCGIFC